MVSPIQKILSHAVAKNSLIVFSGAMVANILAYVYHLIVGRVLGPERYGELAALFALLYIVNAPSEVLRTILVKFYSMYKAAGNIGQAKSLFATVTKKLAIITVIGGIGILPFVQAFATFLHIREPAYFIYLYLVFASFFLTIVPISILQGYQLFVAATVYNSLAVLIRLLFVVSAFGGVGLVLVTNILSNVIGYFLYLVPIRWLLSAKPEHTTLTRKQIAGYSVPVLLATVGVTLLYNQDVILVKHFFPPFEAGLYSSLSVLGKVIFFASNAIAIVVFPMVAERHERRQDTKKITGGALLVVSAISFGITVGYFLFPDLVIFLFFGRSYQLAAAYVGIFGVFLSLFAVSNTLLSVFLAREKGGAWVIVIISALLQVGLISLFHTNLTEVIYANIFATSTLLTGLLLYYNYAK